ncbi:unnamed protein product [Prorocentrum cordatum]|uniref:Uncharacterized protein n=1 Tax=Prorocentrum cordatum TaxID=2364126 RepID=A0ABN9THT9_9DINO|nr:unnamed protein product [Polarella glacialis]
MLLSNIPILHIIPLLSWALTRAILAAFGPSATVKDLLKVDVANKYRISIICLCLAEGIPMGPSLRCYMDLVMRVLVLYTVDAHGHRKIIKPTRRPKEDRNREEL